MIKEVKEELAIRRKMVVLEWAQELGNVTKACREFKVPRSSFYKWKKAFDAEGKTGLARKKLMFLCAIVFLTAALVYAETFDRPTRDEKDKAFVKDRQCWMSNCKDKLYLRFRVKPQRNLFLKMKSSTISNLK